MQGDVNSTLLLSKYDMYAHDQFWVTVIYIHLDEHDPTFEFDSSVACVELADGVLICAPGYVQHVHVQRLHCLLVCPCSSISMLFETSFDMSCSTRNFLPVLQSSTVRSFTQHPNNCNTIITIL